MLGDPITPRLQTALALLTARESFRPARLDANGEPDPASIPAFDALRNVANQLIAELVSGDVIVTESGDQLGLAMTGDTLRQGVCALLEVAHMVIGVAVEHAGLNTEEILARIADQCRQM